jgi:hypothetical protein
MRFAFIDAEKAHHSVRTMCTEARVSTSRCATNDLKWAATAWLV